MSNTQTKSVLQRAVGGIFLLALIALIALLLLQPSDKLPNTASQSDGSQKPTLSITANDAQKPIPSTPEIQGPALVLESQTSSDPKNNSQNSSAEIISEDLWQSVEQNSHPSNVKPQITDEAIVMASVDAPTTSPSKTSTPEIENDKSKPATQSQEKPKVVNKPKAETPKLELISNTATPPKPAATQPSKALATGKWYVQLGAFSNSANAQKLVTEFSQKGYNVRIQKDKQLNRVQIGPYATKKEAEQVQSRTKGGSLNPSVFQAK